MADSLGSSAHEETESENPPNDDVDSDETHQEKEAVVDPVFHFGWCCKIRVIFFVSNIPYEWQWVNKAEDQLESKELPVACVDHRIELAQDASGLAPLQV